MAGSGRRVFAPGEVLTASNTMNYLMDQTVMNFAGTAARGSAIGTAVAEGMVSYLADTNDVQVYDGSAWNSLVYETSILPTGLVPVTSGTATVAGAGSSVSENALGTISFSTATSLTLDGVFTSDYRNYHVVVDLDANTNAAITNQFRNAGSTLTAAAYNWGHIGLSGGATNTGNGVGTTSLQLVPVTLSASTNILTFDIMTPADASTRTQYVGQFSRSRDTYIIGGTYQSAATDGMTFVMASGNMTGKLTIYGWNQ